MHLCDDGLRCLLISAAPDSPLLLRHYPSESVLRDVYVVVLLEKQPGLPHGENTLDHTEGNAITASQQTPNH